MIRAVRIRTERRQVLRGAFRKALTAHRANVPAKIAHNTGNCCREISQRTATRINVGPAPTRNLLKLAGGRGVC